MRYIFIILFIMTLAVAARAWDAHPNCLHEAQGNQTITGTVAFEQFADPHNRRKVIAGYKLIPKEWDCYEFDLNEGNYRGVDMGVTEIALVGGDDQLLRSLLGKTVNVTGRMENIPGLRYVVIPQIFIESIERCTNNPLVNAPKCDDKRSE